MTNPNRPPTEAEERREAAARRQRKLVAEDLAELEAARDGGAEHDQYAAVDAFTRGAYRALADMQPRDAEDDD